MPYRQREVSHIWNGEGLLTVTWSTELDIEEDGCLGWLLITTSAPNQKDLDSHSERVQLLPGNYSNAELQFPGSLPLPASSIVLGTPTKLPRPHLQTWEN